MRFYLKNDYISDNVVVNANKLKSFRKFILGVDNNIPFRKAKYTLLCRPSAGGSASYRTLGLLGIHAASEMPK
jgi:hypothetical protein